MEIAYFPFHIFWNKFDLFQCIIQYSNIFQFTQRRASIGIFYVNPLQNYTPPCLFDWLQEVSMKQKTFLASIIVYDFITTIDIL